MKKVSTLNQDLQQQSISPFFFIHYCSFLNTCTTAHSTSKRAVSSVQRVPISEILWLDNDVNLCLGS